MAERQAEFAVVFDPKSNAFPAFLAALKKDVRSTVADMQSAADSLQLFKNAQADAAKASTAFDNARQRVEALRAAVDQAKASGQDVGKGLATSMASAEKAFVSAGKALEKANIALENTRSAQRLAASTASLLAAEQRKVGEEMAKQATAAFLAQRAAEKAAESAKRLAQEQTAVAAAFQANKDFLGFKQFRDIQPEINAVRRAYGQLRDSGKLSFGELSVAAARANQSVAALKAEAFGVGAAFTQLRGGVLAIVGAVAGIAAAATNAAQNFRAFAQQMAAVDSIAGANEQQMAKLSEGVQRLSRTMGVDAVESAKALYEILSSGVSAGNALTVLEQSTKAAIAGLTDVATAARVGVGVLNAYGLQVTDLGKVYDVLFRTVDSGVITFPELANNIGEVIPAARAAKVDLETLGAAFVLLTKNGINAAESATSIRGAILALSAPTPEASKRFTDLNITLGNFEQVLQQIGARRLSLQVIRELVPDVRAQRAVLILAQNFDALNDTIGKMNAAAGATERAYGKLANTPQAQVNKFNQAVAALSREFGKFVTSSTQFVSSFTELLNGFNSLDAGTRRSAISMTAWLAAIAGLGLALRTLANPLNLFVGAITSAIPVLGKLTLGLDAATLSMRALGLATGVVVAIPLLEWAQKNVPAVAKFFDLLEIAGGNLALQTGLAFEQLGAAITLNGQAFIEAGERSKLYIQHMRAEFSEVMSGARERVRALTQEQAKLRDELGKSIGVAQESAQGVGGAIAKIASSVKTLLSGVEQQMQLFETRITGLVTKLGEAVAATQQIAQQSIGNVNASMQQQLAALETLGLKEVERARESVEIQRAAAAERLALLNKFAVDAIRAFEAEAAAKAEIQRRAGVSERQIITETNNARRALLQGVLDQYRAHFTALLAQEKQHLDNIKAIEEQRRGINETVEDKIRNLRRQSLTAYEQYADKVRQIEELLSASRQALLKGDNKLAEQFANKALSLTDGIADRVEEAGVEVVSAQQAQTLSINKLREAQVLLNTSLDQRKRAEVEGAEASRRGAEAAAARIKSLTSEVENLQQLASEGISVQILVDQASLVDALNNLDKLTAERDRLVEVQVKVFLAETEKERLSQELSDGITVNIKPRTELIEKALKDIEALEPSVSANVQPALDELEKIRVAAEKVIVARMQIESNIAVLQVEKQKLAKDFETVWTVKRRVVEERAGGGPVGDGPAPPLPFAKGGPAKAIHGSSLWAQAFAAGGSVFRRPTWRKVPGTGDQDTVPAALESGSFVVRKKASQHYGDGLMNLLATGRKPVQRFAVGGIAERILRAIRGGSRLQGAPGSAAGLSLGRGSTGEIIEAAYRIFNPLIDASKTLPKSRTGQNLHDYLARVLDIITTTYSAQEAGELLENIAGISDNLMASIRTAFKFRVPIVMGAFADAPNENTGPSELFKQLVENMRTGGRFKQGTSNPYDPYGLTRFAGGGSAADTIRALLTPGEYVVRRPAVQAAERRFGAGFLDAINNMRIPREVFANIGQPPRIHHFGAGGLVGETNAMRIASQPPAATTERSRGDTIINVTASVADIFTPDNIRRHFVPIWNDIQRRTS